MNQSISRETRHKIEWDDDTRNHQMSVAIECNFFPRHRRFAEKINCSFDDDLLWKYQI